MCVHYLAALGVVHAFFEVIFHFYLSTTQKSTMTLHMSKIVDKSPPGAQPAIPRIRFNNMLQTYGFSWMTVLENLSSPLFVRLNFSACGSGNA